MEFRSSPTDDAHIALIQNLYSRLKIFPQSPQYTILSAFYLTTTNDPFDCKVISLGTGTKCLPESRLTAHGEAVHDSHAETLARRGAIRWLLEEILRERNSDSQWIERRKDAYQLRDGVELRMYISTVPCGDASTRFLAAFQDPDMAALKDSAVAIHPEGPTTARGRNNYHLYNVLRTKPGRADSPPTLSLSCSDKIASWAWLGMQGALGARFFPGGIYIGRIIIGEVPATQDADLLATVGGDCKRALGGRLDGLLTSFKKYNLHIPTIAFTSVPFIHSRLMIGLSVARASSNESLCWRAEDPDGTIQILINGFKRGVSPKHRKRLHDDKFLPHLCKLSMLRLYARVCREVFDEIVPVIQSYHDIKTGSDDTYYEAKTVLKGPSGPFSAWWTRKLKKNTNEIRGLERWEGFNIEGEICRT